MDGFKIEYGTRDKYRDVTDVVLRKLYRNGTIFLPSYDSERAQLLGDPLPGVVKEIVITFEENGKIKQLRYPHGIIGIFNVPLKGSEDKLKRIIEILNTPLSDNNFKIGLSPEDKLKRIHDSLILFGGNFKDEYPEQLLAAEFISPNAKVLELGGNIGRNTLVIASLLDDDRNLVSLECDENSANILECNKYNNRFRFSVEAAAISDHKLYLSGWNSYNESNKPLDAKEVKTITWPTLRDKYGVEFDTLVADCEGSLFDILKSYPEMLTNIRLVIVENDYTDFSQKPFVDSVFMQYGLKLIRSNPGPTWMPASIVCRQNFYEVWMK